jgi:hypothetical protein
MTVSVKAPTSTTGSIQLNGSDVLTIDSSGNLTAPNNLTVTGSVSGGSGLGKILQIVNANANASVTTTSTSYVSFGPTATITPSSSSSKIFVLVQGNWWQYGGTRTEYAIALFKDATNLSGGDGGVTSQAESLSSGSYALTWLDSPATTSSISYTVKAQRIDSGTNTFYNGLRGTNKTQITLFEVAA